MRKRNAEELKDSGVEWVGSIPHEWNILKLKYLAIVETGSTPPKSNESNYSKDGMPWVKPDDLGDIKSVTTSSDYLSEAGAQLARIVPKNSVLVGCIGDVGKMGVAGTDLTTNQQINAVIFSEDKFASSFGKYSIISSTQEHARYSTKVVVPILKKSNQENIKLPVPPKPEQKSIATFLDRKTEAIDKLIEKKQQLIEKLKEKRQALITKAVTKGLNPDVPMRDSEIEWLGEIPAHWDVEKLKHLFKEIDNRSETGEEELLTVSHKTGITKRSEKDVNMFKAESNVGYKICEVDDLVINTMWAWMGALGISCIKGIVSPSYNVYRRRNDRLLLEYFNLYIKSPGFIVDVNRYSKGVWSSRLRLYPDEFFMIKIPLPPIDEQGLIVQIVDEKFRELDKLEGKFLDQIDKLKEYRQSLISAAVTGKIDVRDEVEATVNETITS